MTWKRADFRAARCAAGSLLAVLSGVLASCQPTPRTPVEQSWLIMDTRVSVSLPVDRSGDMPDAVGRVQNRLQRVAKNFSAFDADSELGRVNAAAGVSPVPVSRELAELCRRALDLSQASGGAFDPTVGPLMTLWGFRGKPPPDWPTPHQISNALARTGWPGVRIDATPSVPHRIMLTRPGMHLDLGAIAKGYAVDRAQDDLVAAGYADFLINLGGNIRVRGRPAPHRPNWRIAIRDPFDTERLLGSFLLFDGEGVATSGNYERFVEIDGRRVSHIVDPRTGQAVKGVAGVTVLAPSAEAADGLSTALFVLGIEAGMNVLAQHPGAEALWVPDRQPLEIWISPGLRARFTPLPSYVNAIRIASDPP